MGEIRKRNFISKLKDHYRLTIFNDSTFQSVWSIKLNRLKVLAAAAIVSSVIVMLVTFLIAATPLREYIPGYPNAKQRQMMVNNVLKIDSLEAELAKRDAFFEGIKAIVSGNVPFDTLATDSAGGLMNVKFNKYNHDSVFQDDLLEEQLSLSMQGNTTRRNEISQMHFFVPVKGIVTNAFNAATDHLGVDLVSDPNARICAVSDGTVIFSGWTLETGYVIYIQHEADLVSVYKHNAELLKSAGDQIKAGEPVAIIGNSGEFTTGPHLHFELWHRGNAIDPQQYIDF
ncbi:MAG TPA: peptidase M23 [Prolixibacteraceae bacterium]|nr:peptidase M23 [Prolixibacteraceae bacterium]